MRSGSSCAHCPMSLRIASSAAAFNPMCARLTTSCLPFTELVEYLDGPSGRFLRGENGLLLLGSWGTGKTHLLCDIARQRLQAGAPALLVMASSLPSGADVLDGIALPLGWLPPAQSF